MDRQLDRIVSASSYQGGTLPITNNPGTVHALFPTALIAVMLAVFLQYFGMHLLPAVLNILCLHLFLAVMMLGCGGVFVGYSTGSTMRCCRPLLRAASPWTARDCPSDRSMPALILGPTWDLNLRRGITYTGAGGGCSSPALTRLTCWDLLSAEPSNSILRRIVSGGRLRTVSPM